MKIADILRPECVLADIKATTKRDILEELARPVAREYHLDLEEVVAVLQNREKLGSTGIGEGVAIPHGKINDLKDVAAAIGRSARGLDFEAIDGKPCHIFFMLVAPSNSASLHVKALARASMLLKNPALRQKLMGTRSSGELYQIIIDYDSTLDE
ncbi:MAG TPA: PTS sugar transporter subunit IIA [Deltaproteobacteria bacterium]|nr:PTS sugar transporter subunit IIA [Deltaproteobacteria bacterium]HQI81066.1 PTS sugar transporter subunit IIA [Deltaproteobacteria bacterium]